MDKNTVWGILCMVLVFMAFMWFSPKNEPETTPDNSPEATEQTAALTADRLSPTEREWLIKNISENGSDIILPDSTHATRLNSNGIDLTVAGDSVFGQVTVDNVALDWNDIASCNLKKMSAAQQRKAIEAVRQASVDMGRYGKFASFRSGDNTTVKLENDVLSLELNSKSGSITRAVLKDYKSEYNSDETDNTSHDVVIFEGDKNTFNFQLPLPQPVETADLFFKPAMVNDSTVRMTLDVAPDAFWGLEYTLPKGNSYVVRIKVVQKNMAAIVQSNNRNLGLLWHQDIHRQEKGRMFEERNSGLYYKFAGGSVENLSEAKRLRGTPG